MRGRGPGEASRRAAPRPFFPLPPRAAGRRGEGSCLSLCFEHSGGERILGRFARPQHELEGLIIALASLERSPKQRLALAGMGVGAGEQEPVAIEQKPVLAPQIEMAKPELLVDQRHQLIDFREPPLRDLEIESASEMQRLQIVAPVQRDVIVAPGARDGQREFVRGGALEAPGMNGGDVLDHIHWVGEMVVDRQCRSHTSPLWPRQSFAFPSCPSANHFVNQLYIGESRSTNAGRDPKTGFAKDSCGLRARPKPLEARATPQANDARTVKTFGASRSPGPAQESLRLLGEALDDGGLERRDPLLQGLVFLARFLRHRLDGLELLAL